ncbi:MAG: nucleotide exchange factor GrpE [Chloracidobacterium sp.]|nr:nucleotide exchange factor GrpE [Chloracidobacterium sp.]
MKKNKLEQNHTAQEISAQLSEKPEAAESRSEIERLKEEIERLNHELRREHEMYVRNLADFDNYRRRVDRDRAQAAQASKRELIVPLLEVMDDFERELGRANDDPQLVVAGARVIHHRLAGLLATQGVEAFDSRGKYFNPLMHEAVDMVKSERAEPGTVLEEVSRGWRWGDDLLRPARVRVAQ